MLSNLFNPKRRKAAREFEIAIHYLLHDSEKLTPLLKEKYKGEWPGFIDDVLNGARPYEEATVVIGLFLQQAFKDQGQANRDAVTIAIANNNQTNPPNLLRIIGQISYFLYLAEREGDVREKLWAVWLNDMAKVFSESGELSAEQCGMYLLTLCNAYREAKLKSLGHVS